MPTPAWTCQKRVCRPDRGLDAGKLRDVREHGCNCMLMSYVGLAGYLPFSLGDLQNVDVLTPPQTRKVKSVAFFQPVYDDRHILISF